MPESPDFLNVSLRQNLIVHLIAHYMLRKDVRSYDMFEQVLLKCCVRLLSICLDLLLLVLPRTVSRLKPVRRNRLNQLARKQRSTLRS